MEGGLQVFLVLFITCCHPSSPRGHQARTKRPYVVTLGVGSPGSSAGTNWCWLGLSLKSRKPGFSRTVHANSKSASPAPPRSDRAPEDSAL